MKKLMTARRLHPLFHRYCLLPCLRCVVTERQVVKVTGVPTSGMTMTVLMRGSNKLVLDEAERSVHDALCVVRSLVRPVFLLLLAVIGEVTIVCAEAQQAYFPDCASVCDVARSHVKVFPARLRRVVPACLRECVRVVRSYHCAFSCRVI